MDGILIIDYGTSKMRAFVIDCESGSTSINESMTYSPENPEDIWNKSQIVTKKAIEKAVNRQISILAISFSWFGANIIAMDANGDAIAPLIVSYDNKAEEEAGVVRSRLSADKVQRTPRGGMNGQSVPAKVLYLKNHLRTEKETIRFGSVQQYILEKLGFPDVWDQTIAATTQAFDIENCKWDPDIVKACEMEESVRQSKVCNTDTVLGELDHFGEVKLPYSIPLVIGGHDCVVAQFGQGVTPDDGETLCNVSGTYDMLESFRRGYLLTDDADCLTAPGISYYTMLAGGPTGAIVSDFARSFCEDGDNALSRLFEAAKFDEVPEEDIFYPEVGQLPEFLKSRSVESAFAAVVKSITLREKKLFDSISKMNGKPFTAMRIGGGGARSPEWLQLKADILGIRVDKCANIESSGLGAAVIAAKAVGRYKTYEDAVKQMCGIEKSYLPKNI